MKQVKTTIILGAFALVSLILAVSVYLFTPDGKDSQNELIGEVFFPDFKTPAQAASMRLITWDAKEKSTREFEVRKVKQKRLIDGKEQEVELWAIPSHDNYPVESPERLYETAGSMMNIVRLSLASNSREEHDRLGVVDPLDKDAKLKEPQSVGDRIMLLDDSGNSVCDLIIGNAVDAEAEIEVGAEKRELEKGQRYYVRRPDENETYVARLNLRITTEFSEWIDSDLLQVGEADVTKIEFLNYKVVPKFIEKFGGQVPLRTEFNELLVEKKDGSWTVADLKSDTEEFDSGSLFSLESQLQNLRILEVQPKPTYQDSDIKVLNADLSVNAPKGMSRNEQLSIQQQLLGPKGFHIGLVDENSVKLALLSANGEMNIGTDAGLVYHLVFGYDVKLEGEKFEFSGAKEDEKADDAKKDGDPSAGESDDDSQQGKIMSVHVTFDKELIKKPTPPIKPVPPQKPDAGLPVPSADPQKGPVPPKDNEDPQPKAPPAKSADDLKNNSKSNEPKAENKNSDAKNPGKDAQADKSENKDPKSGSGDKSGADSAPPKKKTTEEKPDAGKPKQEAGAEKQSSNGAGQIDPDDVNDNPSPEMLVSVSIPDQEKDGQKNPQDQGNFEQEKAKDSPKADQSGDAKPAQDQKTEDANKKQKPKTETESTNPDDGKKASGSPAPKTTEKPGDNGNAKSGGVQEKAPQEDGQAAKQEGNQNAEPMKTPEQIFAEKLKAYNDAMTQYKADLDQYNEDLKQYEEDLKAYEKKIEDGKKKVAILNARFADWFYIVDTASIDKIMLKRSDVVKPKEKNDAPNANGGNPIPGLNNPLNQIPRDPMPSKGGAEGSNPEGPKGSKEPKEPKENESPDKGPAKPDDAAKSNNRSENNPANKKAEPAKQKKDSADKGPSNNSKDANAGADRVDGGGVDGGKRDPGKGKSVDPPAEKLKPQKGSGKAVPSTKTKPEKSAGDSKNDPGG